MDKPTSPKWHLEDAEEVHKQYPYTFWLPSQHAIQQLKEGRAVKLIFVLNKPKKNQPGAERMWVQITSRNGINFTGVLDNEPVVIKGLKLGDIVHFEAKNVIDTNVDDPTSEVPQLWEKLCFATNRILEDEEKPNFLYREEPMNAKDSGWRFMVGDESQEFMDDSENSSLVTLAAILNVDDSFLNLLSSPVGSAFEWNKDTQQHEATKLPD